MHLVFILSRVYFLNIPYISTEKSIHVFYYISLYYTFIYTDVYTHMYVPLVYGCRYI